MCPATTISWTQSGAYLFPGPRRRRALAALRGHKRRQIGDNEIGNGVDAARSASSIPAVYPYTGDAEFVGRLDVVVQAFRDVQPLFLSTSIRLDVTLKLRSSGL